MFINYSQLTLNLAVAQKMQVDVTFDKIRYSITIYFINYYGLPYRYLLPIREVSLCKHDSFKFLYECGKNILPTTRNRTKN